MLLQILSLELCVSWQLVGSWQFWTCPNLSPVERRQSQPQDATNETCFSTSYTILMGKGDRRYSKSINLHYRILVLDHPGVSTLRRQTKPQWQWGRNPSCRLPNCSSLLSRLSVVTITKLPIWLMREINSCCTGSLPLMRTDWARRPCGKQHGMD